MVSITPQNYKIMVNDKRIRYKIKLMISYQIWFEKWKI